MSFITVSAGVGIASGLYGIGKSISQSSQANKVKTARPSYQIPQEFMQNAALAKNMAQIGMPQQQYNNQQNAINSNQASGIQALNRSANPGSGIASVVRASNDANNNLNAQDAMARQQNQRYFIGQNAQLGQQRLAQQQYNDFDRYTENYNESAALKGAANQNLQNGVNGLSNVAMGLATMGGSPGSVQTMGQKNNMEQLSPAKQLGFGSGFYTAPNTNFNPYGTNGVNPANPLYTGWNQFTGQPSNTPPYYPSPFIRK